MAKTAIFSLKKSLKSPHAVSHERPIVESWLPLILTGICKSILCFKQCRTLSSPETGKTAILANKKN